MEPLKCCLSFIFQGMSHEAPEEEERVLNVQFARYMERTYILSLLPLKRMVRFSKTKFSISFEVSSLQ